eukprot:1146092-Pelagomonas_calceolata.AAC.3
MQEYSPQLGSIRVLPTTLQGVHQGWRLPSRSLQYGGTARRFLSACKSLQESLTDRKAAEIEDQIKLDSCMYALGFAPSSTSEAEICSKDGMRERDPSAYIINSEYRQLDVLINNAGISHVEEPYTKEGIGALAQKKEKPLRQ